MEFYPILTQLYRIITKKAKYDIAKDTMRKAS